MLRRSVFHAAKRPAAAAVPSPKNPTVARSSSAANAAASSTSSSSTRRAPLMPYAIRRASACEMLYGGARVQHLVQPPFQLHKIQSEHLPSPSLDAERHDLGLEMQLPRDLSPYNNIHMSIQRQVGADVNTPDAAVSKHSKDGFDMSDYYASLHHPERHHNSSLPYTQHDTNNVMALRLFPVNIGIRARTEAVRIRTEDCLRRLRDSKLCAQVRQPLQHPLPMHQRSQYTAVAGSATADDASTAHLRGAAAHPPPSALSIFTRPVDTAQQGGSAPSSHAFPVHPFARTQQRLVRGGGGGGDTASSASSSAWSTRVWMPLQMMKPMGHNWSAAMRSSGTRGPHMQLMQERLDQKGFGWKRKSRSLWQQDVATAGFRPHRYF